MKHPLHEALMRRKMQHHSPDPGAQDVVDEQANKKLDLAPEVKDRGHVRIDVKVGGPAVEGSPMEEASESPEEAQAEGDDLSMLMGHKPMPHEIARLQSMDRPRSLLEAAQKAALKKKG